MVLVGKKDHSWQLCFDYYKLKVVIKRNTYPLPRIDDSIGDYKVVCSSVPWIWSCEATVRNVSAFLDGVPTRKVQSVPERGTVPKTHEPTQDSYQPNQGGGCKEMVIPALHTGVEILIGLCRLQL